MSGPDDETLRECEPCAGKGTIAEGEERGSGYAYSIRECPTCRGLGMVTLDQYRAWRIAQKIVPPTF